VDNPSLRTTHLQKEILSPAAKHIKAGPLQHPCKSILERVPKTSATHIDSRDNGISKSMLQHTTYSFDFRKFWHTKAPGIS
jgi:hypothetical protein